MDLAEQIIKRFLKLSGARSTWRGVWEEAARYCLPNAAPLKVLGSNTDGSRKQQPLDTTGVDALTKLCAWLFSTTIYPGEQWFSLKARGGKEASSDMRLQKFLEDAARKTLEVIANSNCTQVYQQFLRSYVCFGTGVFYSELNDDGELICRQFSITDDVCVAESSTGMIDTVYRRFQYTARQAVQEFGAENLSEDVRKAAAKPEEQDKPFKFIHAVYSRKERDKEKVTPENKPWASVYVEVDKKKTVKEGGYDTFPYCVPRFSNTGEVYGRCPAMNAIPALRSINIAIYSYLKNVEFNANPMVFLPPELHDRTTIEAGALNPLDAMNGKIEIWAPSGDMNSPLEFAETQKQAVREMFFNDVFQYLEDRKNMTATEAQLRYDEMIQGIAPVLANLHSEFFGPFIKRVVMLLIENETITVPSAYQSKNKKYPDFDVVYTTRLDTKLKGVLNANVINFVRMVGEYAAALAAAPMAAAYLDSDKIIKGFAANNNVSNDALYDDDRIQENLEAQAEQAQQAQETEMVRPIDLQKAPAPGSVQAALTEAL